jgi:hypothetical protein
MHHTFHLSNIERRASNTGALQRIATTPATSIFTDIGGGQGL